MQIQRAYKTEIHPNNVQRTALLRHAGAARFVYNWGLARKKAQYEAGEKTLGAQKLDGELRGIIDAEFPWMREITSHARQSALADLDKAYKNFFDRIKKGVKGKATGFPKFKSRRNGIGSFRVYQVAITDTHIRLPRIGLVRLHEHGYLPIGRYGDGGAKRIVSTTVSERAGRWFVSVQVEEEIPDVQPLGKPVTGIHFGLRVMATTSEGLTFQTPKPLERNLRKLRRLSRALSRKQKGSKNREKARRPIATLHARIADIRYYAAHRISHAVTRKSSAIGMEKWDIKAMMSETPESKFLARQFADRGIAEIQRQIAYKSIWRGVAVTVAPEAYPTSRTCSACGVIRKRPVAGYEWVCNACGARHDREMNAAQNLKRVAGSRPETLNACGQEGSTHNASCATSLVEAGSEQPDVRC
jgi:putative transposase